MSLHTPPAPVPSAASAPVSSSPSSQSASAAWALDSATLLRGAREVVIRHGVDVYRLRHTRNDKLILTK